MDEGLGYELADREAVLDALRESEARFRALFFAIDEGYCLCEMVLDADGVPVDYRFLDANPLFETMTGLIDAVGHTALELVPDLETHWVETYGRVALGGEPLRFQQGSPALGRSFDVFATPVEPRGRFALVFNDVTQRDLADQARRDAVEAERRARVQAELLAGLDHDLEALPDATTRVGWLADRLTLEVADAARVELPGSGGPVVSERGDVGGAFLRVSSPVDVGGPALGSVTLGLADADGLPPEREMQAFVRRVADHVGTIVARARVREQEHRVALRLQEVLLPAGILATPGVSIAARYQAGSAALHVGGDFYDTFTLPGGRVGLAVGDVVGHGLEAAATMGRLRTALTALAPHADGPGQLLSHLDAYATGPNAVDFATVCCAFLDPATGELRYASAGHPPTLHVPTGGEPAFLEDGRSTPLHDRPRADRPEATLTLGPGSLLVLYSDGLVERRGESLAVGLDRLRDTVLHVRDEPVDVVCEHVVDTLVALSEHEDDVVVLCLRMD